MHVKKTITLPQELEIEVEDRLIGTYYASLSDVIRDGLRKILAEYKRKNEIEIAVSLYKDEKITLREAAAIMGVPMRKALQDLSERDVYLRYGSEELEEDLE
jgi:predicted HTH domain antitoxin|nr:hypothetical protein GZ35D7_13 [uncultured archaeon GZfos35D7]